LKVNHSQLGNTFHGYLITLDINLIKENHPHLKRKKRSLKKSLMMKIKRKKKLKPKRRQWRKRGNERKKKRYSVKKRIREEDARKQRTKA